MLEIILLCGVVFLIVTFFYKQATHDFRIHQVDATQREAMSELWRERVPLVIRKLPLLTIWSHTDVQQRACYSRLPLFREYSLAEWAKQGTADTVCPWKYEQAEQIALHSHLAVWEKQWMRPLVMPSFSLSSAWLMPRFHCWAGRVPLRRTFAQWTCILPVEGEIVVTIFPETMEPFLPVGWASTFPSEWTQRDTPFVNDIRYMDIVVRPGTGLWMPPHWYVSWSSVPLEAPASLPMVCTLSYHTPISLLAFRMSPHSSE